MYGLIGAIALIFQAGAESYSRKRDDERAIQYEKEQCEFLGVETFKERMRQSQELCEWRKKNGIS